jgi:recombination protein RecT
MANDLVLKTAHNQLEKLLVSKAGALPKDFNQTRFLQNCMTVLQDTKGIEKVQPITIARTMLKGAFLGLDFMNKECYAIPYGNSLQFQTDYKGEVKLAKKYSINPIKDIYAKLVRVGDDFLEEIRDGQQYISFKPQPFNDGEIIGAFAVCFYNDGSMIYETMSKKEIEAVRDNYSKMPKGPTWTKSYGEMCKKTVLRRLCKNISLDFDSIEQRQAWEDGADTEFKDQQQPKGKAKNILDDKEIEEAEYSIIDDEIPDDELPDFMKEGQGDE